MENEAESNGGTAPLIRDEADGEGIDNKIDQRMEEVLNNETENGSEDQLMVALSNDVPEDVKMELNGDHQQEPLEPLEQQQLIGEHHVEQQIEQQLQVDQQLQVEQNAEHNEHQDELQDEHQDERQDEHQHERQDERQDEHQHEHQDERQEQPHVEMQKAEHQHERQDERQEQPHVEMQKAEHQVEQVEVHPQMHKAEGHQPLGDSSKIERVAAYLNMNTTSIAEIPIQLIDVIYNKSIEADLLRSDLQFVQLNMEKITNVQHKKFKELQDSLNANSDKVQTLLEENETLLQEKNEALKELSRSKDQQYQLQNQLNDLERKDIQSSTEYSQIMSSNQKEVLQLNEAVNKLSKTNIDQNTKINQLVKELNDTRNVNFDNKLALTKVTNERNFLQQQNLWFETELNKNQTKLTEILKKSESDYLNSTNEIVSLKNSNETLSKRLKNESEQVITLKKSLEDKTNSLTKLQGSFTVEKSKFETALATSDELVELSKIQISQRQERIVQLETYVEELKKKLSDTINNLQTELKEKSNDITQLKEKLRYTQDALESELHKETQLPHLDSTSDLLVNELGINLASLYTDYSQLKKQLILEKSQKNSLQQQLSQFVEELEAKKPTIASYQKQIAFYKSCYNDTLSKVEVINLEKLEREKECGKLKFTLNDVQSEANSLRKLCKDLGRQLCYYLIHSKIRENGDDNPLTSVERKAIDTILSKSGINKDADSILNDKKATTLIQSDTDELISNRLVEFSNIIELEQKNQQLLMVSRQLGQKLELKESERDSIESEAIEEAKEAIMTLEGELQSVQLRLEAVTNERDAIKEMQPTTNNNNSNSTTNYSYEVKHLSQINDDLKRRLNDTEKSVKEIETQSKKTITSLNDKLRSALQSKNDLNLQLSNMKHSVELAETKLGGIQKLLDNSMIEIEQLKKESSFWRTQASKQEKLFLSKLNELRDAEQANSINQIAVNSLRNEVNMKTSLIESYLNDIDQLRKEKNQLNEFVLNLQGLFKQSESSTKELSERLNHSIENYQNLQQKLADREEKLLLISNQSELAWKAQNTKLEQVNELSQTLLDTKVNLKKKDDEIVLLNEQINDLYAQIHASKNRFITSSSSSSSNDSDKTRLLVELEQLKEELTVAETQANEMTTIAKSAESALSNATKTFEAYRLENDSKYQALLREKVLLEDEINELKQDKQAKTEELQLANAKFTEELAKLRVDLDSANQKALAYDLLKKETEARFVSLNRELELQARIVQEAQSKYQKELEVKQDLNEKVGELHDTISESQATIAKLTDELGQQKMMLVSKEEELVQENEMIKKELDTVHQQLNDFKQQNVILMNQLDVGKRDHVGDNYIDNDNDNDKDLRQVIAYLRSECQSSEAKAITANEEKVKLTQRVHQLLSDLEVAQSELTRLQHSQINNGDDLAQQHDKLKEQIEQLNILRESNMTLRNENVASLRKIETWEAQAKRLEQELRPLQEEIRKLRMDISVKDQQVSLLIEENERLKGRLNDAAQSQAQVQAEVVQAQTPVQHVGETEGSPPPNNEQEYELLKQKYNNIRDKANAKLQAQNERIKSLSESITKLKEELEAKEELQNSHVSEIQQLKSELEAKIESHVTEVDQLKSELETKAESHLTEVQQLKSELQAKDEHGKENEVQLKQLQDEVGIKITQAKEETRKQTEKLYDMKMKMLNKKLERIEAANTKTSTAADTTPAAAPADEDSNEGTAFGSSLKRRSSSSSPDPKKPHT